MKINFSIAYYARCYYALPNSVHTHINKCDKKKHDSTMSEKIFVTSESYKQSIRVPFLLGH